MPNLWCSCLVVRAQGPPFDLHGGGAGLFVVDKLYISTRLYRAVLGVKNFFHAGSVRNYLFQKYSSDMVTCAEMSPSRLPNDIFSL